jgi:signal transduction histidine kinase
MDVDAIDRRYRELQAYVGWTEDDARRVRSVSELLEPHLTDLVRDFYAEIDRHPDARRVITGGPAQVERLKGTLEAWLRQLLRGPYDRDYAAGRWRVGWRHVEIGLDQVYTNAALSLLRRGLMRRLTEALADDLARTVAVKQSLDTLIDLDLAIIEDAYQTEYYRRQQRSDMALRSERLAAIGQMVAGLAHESGNALQRSQACLQMLANRAEGRPDLLDLVDRVQAAQDHLLHLYENVRGYAANIRLEAATGDLADLWRLAWHNLEVQRKERATVLREHALCDTRCRVDQFRLQQVFRNVLENALAACPDPVQIDVTVTAAEIQGRPALRVSVRDNGPGLAPDQRDKIFEPFYTTKTKGTGLGLALARRIVEAHDGRIEPGDGGPGCEIVILIPNETQ